MYRESNISSVCVLETFSSSSSSLSDSVYRQRKIKEEKKISGNWINNNYHNNELLTN